MGLFDSSEGEIFKNEEVFSPEYLPNEIIHRDKEVKEIAYFIKGVLKGNPANVFLHGPTGSGKTSCAKYVLKELEEYSGKVKNIYINCWHYSTRYSILSQIAYSLDQFVPRRGLAPDQLIEIIIEYGKKEGKIPVIILDEVDTLCKKKEEGVLYDLLRIGESLGGKVSCILITNDYGIVMKLDQRIKSSFVQRSIQFVPYRPSELRDILNERARAGLFPESYDEEIVGACAGFGARNKGDARIAVRLLWNSAKEAEKESRKKIEIEDVEKAKKQVLVEKEGERKEKLNDNDNEILENISSEWVESSELYNKLNLDKRKIRISMETLEKLGFIESKIDRNTGSKSVRKL